MILTCSLLLIWDFKQLKYASRKRFIAKEISPAESDKIPGKYLKILTAYFIIYSITYIRKQCLPMQETLKLDMN